MKKWLKKMIINYNLLNSLYLTNLIEKLPKIITKKIHKIFKIYFVPTKKEVLPNSNYPVFYDYAYQNKLINDFQINQKLNSFMTYPNLINLLCTFFKKDEEFNFLDFGGENIDFYLKLHSEFPKANYFIFNQKSILDNLKLLKEENNFKNFNIIYDEKKLTEKKYDFINLGSVIQYVGNYENLISELIRVSRKYIFFSGTHFYDSVDNKKNIIVKQVNILPKTFYLYFFNKKFFYSNFLKNGFKINFESKNLTDNINYKNFKNNFFSSINYIDILFEKTKSF